MNPPSGGGRCRRGGTALLGRPDHRLYAARGSRMAQRVWGRCPTWAAAARINFRDRLLIMGQADREETMSQMASHVGLRDSAFDEAPLAQIALELAGTLALANDRARRMFGLSSRDLGRPLQDLELSYRPVELRSCIEQAYAERRPVRLRDVEWPASPGGAAWLDVEATPLQDPTGNVLGGLVSFEDTTRYRRRRGGLRGSPGDVGAASG